MKRITGLTWVGKYSCPFEAVVPEPADVRQVLPKRAAELAIGMCGVDEVYIHHHLSIGSTPPTKVPVWKVPWRLAIIQKAIWKLWDSSRGCICL